MIKVAFIIVAKFLFSHAADIVEKYNLTEKVQVGLNSSKSLACSYSATCNAGGVEGICVSASSGCCTGTITAGLCPGSDDIKCCTSPKCTAAAGSGTCIQSSLCSSRGGTSYAGYCSGPSDLQCCVQGSSTACSTPYGSGTCISTSSCTGTSYPGYCPGAADIQCCVKGGTKISRDTIVARAQDWVNRKIPYSQTATTDGYRQDCSGYVSMAWMSSQPGHTTYNMQVLTLVLGELSAPECISSDICTRISKDQMQRGDALLEPNSHVLLFDSWVNTDTFWEFAEHGTGQVAAHDQTSYSYYANLGYFPCRYNNVA